jgi:hypothetical protein
MQRVVYSFMTHSYATCFLRVRAAFLAEAERSAAGLRADALPPSFPPLRDGA